MDLDSWMIFLSATNDASKAPTKPFTVLLGPDQEPFTFSTDCIIIAVASWEPMLALHPVDELDPKEAQEQVHMRVVERVQSVQAKAVEVGVIDALSLKELVGDATWGDEAHKDLMSSWHPAMRIMDTYYSKPVLARTLAAWTSPTACVLQADVLGMPTAKVLLLRTANLLVLCSPYWTEDGEPPANVLEMPDWLFIPKK